MSKIDRLVEDVAAIKEHCSGCAQAQRIYLDDMKEVKHSVQSLNDTRTFQYGMLKVVTWLMFDQSSSRA